MPKDKMKLASDLEEIILKWQSAMASLRDPAHEFPPLHDLDALTKQVDLQSRYQSLHKKSGIEHRNNAIETYDSNVDFILDYVACYLPPLLNHMLGQYNKDLFGIAKALANIPLKLDKHFDPAYCYLDDDKKVPYIYSHRVYRKLQWMEWLFCRVSDLVNKKENGYHRAIQAIVNLFISARMETTITRLNEYAEQHPDIQRLTIDELEQQYDQQNTPSLPPPDEKAKENPPELDPIDIQIPLMVDETVIEPEDPENLADELIVNFTSQPSLEEKTEQDDLESNENEPKETEPQVPTFSQSIWQYFSTQWFPFGRNIYQFIQPIQIETEKVIDNLPPDSPIHTPPTVKAILAPTHSAPMVEETTEPPSFNKEIIEPVNQNAPKEELLDSSKIIAALDTINDANEAENAFIPIQTTQQEETIETKISASAPEVKDDFESELKKYKQQLIKIKETISNKIWSNSPAVLKKNFACKLAAIDKFLLFQANRPVSLTAEEVEKLKEDKPIIRLIQKYSPNVKVPQGLATFIPDQKILDDTVDKLESFIGKAQLTRMTQPRYQQLWHQATQSFAITTQVNAATKLKYLLSGKDLMPDQTPILFSKEEEAALRKDDLGDLVKAIEKKYVKFIPLLLAGTQLPSPPIRKSGS